MSPTASKEADDPNITKKLSPHEFCSKSNSRSVCGRCGHSLKNCQQLSTHFLLKHWLHSSSDNHNKAKEVTEHGQTMQANYGLNEQSAVCANRTILPAYQGQTDNELMETLHEEDEELEWQHLNK